MRILHRGTPPEHVTLTATCRTCSTQIEFAPIEAERVSDQRDGDYYKIACPVCQRQITKSASAS